MILRHLTTAMILCCAQVGQIAAQEAFTLTSPAFTYGGDLPADLRCSREGGDGLSPPLTWTPPPDGTESLALIMEHYPRGRVPGEDAPSQYWLLWNVTADTTALPRGNPASIGNEGADKDARRTGYTPPCSPPGARHVYTITLYALSSVPETLPDGDSGAVDWTVMSQAIEQLVIGSSSIAFWN